MESGRAINRKIEFIAGCHSFCWLPGKLKRGTQCREWVAHLKDDYKIFAAYQ